MSEASPSAGSNRIELTVPAGASGRVDRYLGEELSHSGLSRSVLQELIKSGAVLVNGSRVKTRYSVESGDEIVISIPEPTSDIPEAEEILLTVLFEDEDVIVVNKAHGMVVHPGSGNSSGTLVNALLHHCCGRLSTLADPDRPGIVHRLDKDTSGCLVAAKSDVAYESLVAQFSGRETGKVYFAVTHRVPANDSGTIHNQVGRHPVNRQKMAVLEAPAGKEAITDFEVVHSDEFGSWALVKCIIHTGRTHQIRVHLKEALHCPILGDPIYGAKGKGVIKVERLMLHAAKLSFTHPVTAERMTFEAELPDEFSEFLPVEENPK
ncbi:MAG: RluA family pseudouridine synthase [Verrucomicrobiales bacterium]|nr:RluA family pseudouridine synthase [Verrucomicrobiales bacterium]